MVPAAVPIASRCPPASPRPASPDLRYSQSGAEREPVPQVCPQKMSAMHADTHTGCGPPRGPATTHPPTHQPNPRTRFLPTQTPAHLHVKANHAVFGGDLSQLLDLDGADVLDVHRAALQATRESPAQCRNQSRLTNRRESRCGARRSSRSAHRAAALHCRGQDPSLLPTPAHSFPAHHLVRLVVTLRVERQESVAFLQDSMDRGDQQR